MSYDKQKSKLKSMFALEESEEVFNAKMQKGLDDARNGRVTPLDDVYAELSKAISELKNGAKAKFLPLFDEIFKMYCICAYKYIY